VPPDATPVPEIICEGDTDRVVYETLSRRGLVPTLTAYPREGESRGGISPQIDRIRALVNLGRTRLVVARDLDDVADGSALLKNLVHDLGAETTVVSEQAPFLLQVGDCRIALLPQGLPGSPLLKRYSVGKHAIDDYILALLEQSVGERPALFKNEGDRDRAFGKMDEVRRLMASQGFTVDSAKRLVFLLKAIANYGVSDGTLARQRIEAAPAGAVQQVFQPLIESFNAAVHVLA
jgi:hypothetical protein